MKRTLYLACVVLAHVVFTLTMAVILGAWAMVILSSAEGRMFGFGILALASFVTVATYWSKE